MRARPRLSYANVAGTLALVVAMSGTAVAATQISGSTIKDRSIPGKKLIRNTLTGAEVKESTLAKVPNADHLDGTDSTGFVRGAHTLLQRTTRQLPGVSPGDPYTKLLTVTGLGWIGGKCFDATNGSQLEIAFTNTTVSTEHFAGEMVVSASTQVASLGQALPSGSTTSLAVPASSANEGFSGIFTVFTGDASRSVNVVFGGLTKVDDGANCQLAVTSTTN
jgi:hypothetical protein